MKIKGLIDEDFVNYKKPSMFICTPHCSFKCDRECGSPICQNSKLANAPIIDIDDDEIIQRFISNPISEAIVMGGLEPFDDFNEIFSFILDFRSYSNADVVIYTGYYPDEIPCYIEKLSDNFKNIIIKFGRFLPNQTPHYDNVLGVELASDNQYGIKLEDINI